VLLMVLLNIHHFLQRTPFNLIAHLQSVTAQNPPPWQLIIARALKREASVTHSLSLRGVFSSPALILHLIYCLLLFVTTS